MLALVASFLLSLVASTADVAVPKFGAADVAQLECAITKVEPQEWGTLLQVEVRSPTALAAEPLAFDVVAKSSKKGVELAPERIWRVDFSYVGRFGRPAPVKGKERYWLHTRLLAADVKFEVRVGEASFFTGAAAAKPKFELSKPSRVDVPGYDSTPHAATAFHVSQTSGLDLDLVFRASFTAPRDQDALVGVRVRSGVEREWILSELASSLRFDLEAGNAATNVEKLELVDWCYVAPTDAKADERDFRAWYDDWVRWEGTPPALTGRFRYVLEASDAKWRLQGTLKSTASGSVAVTIESPPAGAKLASLENLIVKAWDEMVKPLRRPTADEVLANTKLRRVSQSAWQVDGPGWSGERAGTGADFLPNFSVRGGAIVASGAGKDLADLTWTTRRLQRGWFVERRINEIGQFEETFDYGELADVPVPRSWSRRFGEVGGLGSSFTSLELSDLALADKPAERKPPAKPKGPGAEALRAAWDFGYRYPRKALALEAEFEAEVATTDRIWQGLAKFEGHVKLAGYDGFLCDADGWDSYAVTVRAKLPEITHGLVAGAFEDRLRLWAGRDFNGRNDFDVVFAGATIAAPAAGGEIEVDSGPFSAYLVREGRIIGRQYRSGGWQRFTWSRVGEAWLVTGAQAGTEDLKAKFARVADQYVPVELEFAGVFGPNWGPERFVLSKVTLR
ncbi:MAG: hypothetical protein NTV21_18510 [Planctomycetota bacterium]|nr:hypothetical protein [Planctomycetota bacterium]